MRFGQGIVVLLVTALLVLHVPDASSAQGTPTLSPNHRTFFSFSYAQGGGYGIGTSYQLSPAVDLTGEFAYASAAGITATGWGLGLNYHLGSTMSFDPYVMLGVASVSVAIPGGSGSGVAFSTGVGANFPLATNLVGMAQLNVGFGGGTSALGYGLGAKYFVSDVSAIRVGISAASGSTAWQLGFDYHFSPRMTNR